MPACVHACMRACMRAYVHACMRAYMHACMRAPMHACIATNGACIDTEIRGTIQICGANLNCSEAVTTVFTKTKQPRIRKYEEQSKFAEQI